MCEGRGKRSACRRQPQSPDNHQDCDEAPAASCAFRGIDDPDFDVRIVGQHHDHPPTNMCFSIMFFWRSSCN